MRAPACVLAVLVVGFSTSARSALGDDKQACLQAFDEGQQLRIDGKLQAARDRLLFCGSDRCPPLVRQDCTQWTTEVLRSMPTVVFGARDAGGHDVPGVRVLVDGVQVADQLDGRSVPIDPGMHTVRFESPSTQALEQQVLVRAGEKDRPVAVVFPASGARPSLAPGSTTDSSATDRGAVESPGPSPLAWVFGGVGLAALGGALALDLSVKSDADKLRASCGATGCPSDRVDPLVVRQDLAGVALGVGVASALVATYFFVFRRASAPSSGASVTWDVLPSLRGASGGVTVRF
jgi:hypothetical protein